MKRNITIVSILVSLALATAASGAYVCREASDGSGCYCQGSVRACLQLCPLPADNSQSLSIDVFSNDLELLTNGTSYPADGISFRNLVEIEDGVFVGDVMATNDDEIVFKDHIVLNEATVVDREDGTINTLGELAAFVAGNEEQ